MIEVHKWRFKQCRIPKDQNAMSAMFTWFASTWKHKPDILCTAQQITHACAHTHTHTHTHTEVMNLAWDSSHWTCAAHCQCQSDDPIKLSWCDSVQIRSFTMKGNHTQKVQWNWEGIVGKLIAVKSLHVWKKDEYLSEWKRGHESMWILQTFVEP
jgi:hypothetical protein